MFPQAAEDVLYIGGCHTADDLQVGRSDVRLAGAKHSVDRVIVDLPLRLPEECLPHGEGTLMGAEFLGEHPARERFSVADIQHVHRAVADVGDHVDALHGSGLFRNCGKALGIDPDAHDANVVGDLLPDKANLLIS